MLRLRLIPCVLLICLLARSVQGQNCTVGKNKNGFLGVDSGVAVPLSFEYILSVSSGTTEQTATTTILPALEIAIVEALARDLIEFCGNFRPGSTSPHIVGFDITPQDSVLSSVACDDAGASALFQCFNIRCSMSVYVKHTSTNLDSIIGLALLNEAQKGLFNKTSVHPNFEKIKVTASSFVLGTPSTSTPTPPIPLTLPSEASPSVNSEAPIPPPTLGTFPSAVPGASPALGGEAPIPPSIFGTVPSAVPGASPALGSVAPIPPSIFGSVPSAAPGLGSVVPITASDPGAPDGQQVNSPATTTDSPSVDFLKTSTADDDTVTNTSSVASGGNTGTSGGSLFILVGVVVAFFILGAFGCWYYRRRYVSKYEKSGGDDDDDDDDKSDDDSDAGSDSS